MKTTTSNGRKAILFLTFVVLNLALYSEANGQSKTTLLGIENTAWQAPERIDASSSGPIVIQEFYLFLSGGKVINVGKAVLQSQIVGVPNRENPTYNPFGHENPGEWKLTVRPGMTHTVEVNGTYRLNEENLLITFPVWSITASVGAPV